AAQKIVAAACRSSQNNFAASSIASQATEKMPVMISSAALNVSSNAASAVFTSSTRFDHSASKIGPIVDQTCRQTCSSSCPWLDHHVSNELVMKSLIALNA